MKTAMIDKCASTAEDAPGWSFFLRSATVVHLSVSPVGSGRDSVGRGRDSVGRGHDSVGRGRDSVGRGRDSVGRGCDTVGRGRDSVGRGRDSVVGGRDFCLTCKFFPIFKRIHIACCESTRARQCLSPIIERWGVNNQSVIIMLEFGLDKPASCVGVYVVRTGSGFASASL